MKPRRVVEDVVVPVQIVAPYPATVTQRTCLEWFGITKADYLRLVGRGAFPVKIEGQLRIARFEDVEDYLTAGTPKRAKSAPTETPVDPVKAFDRKAFLHKVGFRKGAV